MKDDAKIDRREFTARSLMAALGGVAVSVSACGGGGGGGTSTGGGPTGPSPMPSEGDAVGSVSANHGHVAIIAAADLAAGNMVTLQIRGSSDHPHTVALTGDEVTTIAGGDRVVARSSNEDGHFHEVTFN